jgi:hypothetical protein
MRVYQEFAAYYLVEFYAPTPEAGRQLYPCIPPWWHEVQVFPNMMVPLIPGSVMSWKSILVGLTGYTRGEF